jgi:peptidoglycan hydrolase-like protein with peptidoglycan-binding domain
LAISPEVGILDQKKENTYFTTPVSFGAQNSPDIVVLQEILISEGFFDEKPLGNFSYKTRLGLMKLQKKYTLPVTGSLNSPTLHLLRNLSTTLLDKKLKIEEDVLLEVIENTTSIDKVDKIKSKSLLEKIKNFLNN